MADRSIGGRVPCRSYSWGPSAQGLLLAHNSSHCLGMVGQGVGGAQPTLRVTPALGCGRAVPTPAALVVPAQPAPS